MPKIIVNHFCLDGVMQAPGGPDEDPRMASSWRLAGPLFGPRHGRLVTEGLADADGFLLGAQDLRSLHY